MTYILVDVEADGPCPSLYSMIEIGAVEITKDLKIGKTFLAQLKPISDNWQAEALNAINRTRAETLLYPVPALAIYDFYDFVSQFERPIFVSDNNGFDWQFVNYYFHFYLGKNPFGHSSTNLGSLYKGQVNNMKKSFKHLRDTKHTHNALEDSIGNAEAFIKMVKDGLVCSL